MNFPKRKGFVKFTKAGQTIWGGRGITPATLKRSRWAWEKCTNTDHIEVVIDKRPPILSERERKVYREENILDYKPYKIDPNATGFEALATCELPRSVTDPLAFGQGYRSYQDQDGGDTSESGYELIDGDLQVQISRSNSDGEGKSVTTPPGSGTLESLCRIAELEYFNLTFDPVITWPQFEQVPQQAYEAYPWLLGGSNQYTECSDDERIISHISDAEGTMPRRQALVCVEIPTRNIEHLEQYKRSGNLIKHNHKGELKRERCL